VFLSMKLDEATCLSLVSSRTSSTHFTSIEDSFPLVLGYLPKELLRTFGLWILEHLDRGALFDDNAAIYEHDPVGSTVAHLCTMHFRILLLCPNPMPGGLRAGRRPPSVQWMSAAVREVVPTPQTLIIHFADDGPPLELPWIWVRDHSEDSGSFDHETKQRKIDTFALPFDHPAGEPRLTDDGVHIRWPHDAPDALLPFGLLRDVSGRTFARATSLWSRPADMTITPIPYDDVVRTQEGLAAWLGDIARYGVAMVSDAPSDMTAVEALAKRIGYIRHTVFGGSWTLSSEVVAHADSAYGAATLEPHTDGCYSHDGPGMQMFVCAERTGDGGESVLVDGFAAAEHLRHSEPDAFEILSSVQVPGHYIEDGVHIAAKRPTIRLDEGGELLQVTFNNYDRSPFVLPAREMRDWYDAYRALHERVSDRESWWMHRLEPGDGLIFDNWRCLHGRMAYSGIRVFNGGYLNHEDLESALRLV
jgi:trimethyllysine dioxygenase